MPETNPIRPTTPEAIQLAKTLLRTSRYGAIAVFDAATGRPLASRVSVATDMDGTPLILVSGLAAHTPGLLANPACSLLLGEVGKETPSPMRASRFIVRPGKLREQRLTTPHSATLSQSQSEGFALCGSRRLCLFPA